LASSAAIFSRSTVSTTSNRATASFALLDCSGPIRRSSMSGNSVFSAGLLHAVLAEQALAGLDHRADLVRRKGLRHGDERHRAGRTAGIPLGLADGVDDRAKPRNCVRHLQPPGVDASGKPW
jgi:hypothetical protein